MSLKKNLLRFFQDKIGIGENRDKIAFLEKKIDYQNQLIQRVLPNTFPLNEEEIQKVNVVLEGLGFNGNLNFSISKNDVMFRYPLMVRSGNVQLALQEYLKTGYLAAKNLYDACSEKDFSPKTILDFGAGHGRVSRFFPELFKGAKIFVSEIKPNALNFQKDTFGFTPILHAEDPESFNISEELDLIFVGSVFTHLPENLFKAWLKVLVNALSGDGMLVFSTHNTLDLQPVPQEDFVFNLDSEERLMEEIEDQLENPETYGVTMVSDNFMETTIAELGKYEWIQKRLAFGGRQDLNLIWKRN